MSKPSGPPAPPPTTLGGAIKTFPTFLRKNAVTLIVSAVIAGVIGWAVNVWMLAVKFEGNNDVPVGSPVSGRNNTSSAVIFWILFSMVLFGVVGYARAVGMRRFLRDLRTAPRLLIGIVRREGNAARVHLLFGAGVALLIGLAVPPALGAVISIGLLATLPTVLGAILGSVLGRLFSGVMHAVQPQRRPFGMEAMIVGLLGSGVALSVGFFVSSHTIRLLLAIACIVGAFVFAQQKSPSVAAAAAVLAAFATAAVRWYLAVKHAYADDGGFSECGSNFSTWWHICEGAGAVRRQAVPGGVSAAIGAPLGVFLGQFAGSLASLRPTLFPPTPAGPGPFVPPWLLPHVHDARPPRERWLARIRPWQAGTPLTLHLPDGSSLHCIRSVDGAIAGPWVPIGGHAAPPLDALVHPERIDWQHPAPGDPFGATAPSTDAVGLAHRLNVLHHCAPTATDRAEIERFFGEAPNHPLDHTLNRLTTLEARHHAQWGDRLRDAVTHRHTATPVPVEHPLPGGGTAPMRPAPIDRWEDGVNLPTDRTIHVVGHTASSAQLPGRSLDSEALRHMQATMEQARGALGLDASMAGRSGVVATGHQASASLAGAMGRVGGGLHGTGSPGFTGAAGADLGAARHALPLPPDAQVVAAPGGNAVVTTTGLGHASLVPGGEVTAARVASAPSAVDRFAALHRIAADAPAHQMDRMLGQMQQLDAMNAQARALHSLPLAPPSPAAAVAAPDMSPAMQQMQAMQQELARMHAMQHQMPGAPATAGDPMAAMNSMQAQMRELQAMHQQMPAGTPVAAQQVEAMSAELRRLDQMHSMMLGDQKLQMERMMNQMTQNRDAMRSVVLDTPWRVGAVMDVADATTSVLTPGELAWITGTSRGVASLGQPDVARHARLVLAPAAAPELLVGVAALGTAINELVADGAGAAAVDRATEMRQLLEQAATGELSVTEADTLARQRFGIGLDDVARADREARNG